jgi:hypothetical protein
MEPSKEGNRLEENCHLLFYGNTVNCETLLYRGVNDFYQGSFNKRTDKTEEVAVRRIKIRDCN